MANGFVGKILDVDLSMGRMGDEALDETLCRRFLGGHGLGAKLLYDRMKANVDPLGLESLLRFFTGPLTGTPAIEGNRFAVVCKSPLTETWGDANCGGTFGPDTTASSCAASRRTAYTSPSRTACPSCETAWISGVATPTRRRIC
jgi:aldehyde:ferredoxin oxidoreductase